MFKKNILTGAVASILAVGIISVSSFADDINSDQQTKNEIYRSIHVLEQKINPKIAVSFMAEIATAVKNEKNFEYFMRGISPKNLDGQYQNKIGTVEIKDLKNFISTWVEAYTFNATNKE